jgi:hypothetical protein
MSAKKDTLTQIIHQNEWTGFDKDKEAIERTGLSGEVAVTAKN